MCWQEATAGRFNEVHPPSPKDLGKDLGNDGVACSPSYKYTALLRGASFSLPRPSNVELAKYCQHELPTPVVCILLPTIIAEIADWQEIGQAANLGV